MLIIIISAYGQSEYRNTDILPRMGDRVDMFYKPFPSVSSVLLYPSSDTQKEMGLTDAVDAIVTVA